jgi:ribulose-5-phosphate 4-epimerase/fuculose-1-phosphate aldolase
MLRYGPSYHQAHVRDLVLVGPNGELVEGEGIINVAAYYIHHPILAARPDAVSATHVHTGWGTPFSAEVRMFQPITQESCVFFEDHALFDDEKCRCRASTRASGSPTRSAQSRDHPAQPRSADDRRQRAEAVGSFVQMERVAEAHLKARDAVPISPEAARFAKADLVRYGAGRVAFAAMVARHIGDPSVRDEVEMVVVTFRNRFAPGIDLDEYGQRVGKLFEIVAAMPGFLGIRSYAAEDGERISVIEFASQERSLRGATSRITGSRRSSGSRSTTPSTACRSAKSCASPTSG